MTVLDLDRIVVVDTETGGLDPDAHPVWEISCAWWNDRWHFVTMLVKHDPRSISDWVKANTGYVERFDPLVAIDQRDAVGHVNRIAEGRHFVGMVPSFDEERLRRMLGARPAWHYHLIDAENVAVGWLMAKGRELPLPWSSDDLSRELGVEPDEFARHTAEGDVRWTIAVLAAVGAVPPLDDYRDVT